MHAEVSCFVMLKKGSHQHLHRNPKWKSLHPVSHEAANPAARRLSLETDYCQPLPLLAAFQLEF